MLLFEDLLELEKGEAKLCISIFLSESLKSSQVYFDKHHIQLWDASRIDYLNLLKGKGIEI
jgi:hypothetical protein